jgi:phenylacetate-CoA ligase
MAVHNANGYGLFTGGLGFHYGAERIGATVIPISGGFTARQAMLLRDLGGQVLTCTPSYALAIAQAVREAGIELDQLRLELGLFGGEPFTGEMRAQIERELGLTALMFYGLSEMCGPGVAAECPARAGLHVQEDHFLVEVIDPGSGRALGEGEEGELVFTTLAKEALPLIRYRTGDIGSVTEEACECGRTLARISSLRGRLDDMLIVRGVNLFPSNVEHVLLGVEEVAPHYRLIVERPANLDELTVECEPVSAEIDRAELAARLEPLLREHTGIRIAVSVVEPGGVPRSEGKAVRVLDRRPT